MGLYRKLVRNRMWYYKQLVVFVNFVAVYVKADIRGLNAGPFDLILHHADECEDIGTGQLRLFIKAKKVNRATVVDFEGRFKIPMDDTITASVSAAIFTNGGYKDNYFKEDFSKVCKVGKMVLPKFFNDCAKAIGRLPGEPLCPVIGNTTVKNFSLNLDVEGIPAFFYNKYRIGVELKRKHKKVGCFYLYVEAVPKKSQKRHKKKQKFL